VITNSIGTKLVLIPAGEFMMGSPDRARDDEPEYFARENQKPQHRVRITRPFCLGMYEVTQAEWKEVIGESPSQFKGSRRPVEMVTWEQVVEFCRRLSAREGKTYRLPTEAEWEYACRAGSTTQWCFGDSKADLRKYAWYSDNSAKTTHPVGTKKPNAWGLYDMHGNVEEWCADWMGESYYKKSRLDDPTGPSQASIGDYRVCRGGHYADRPPWFGSAFRNSWGCRVRWNFLGFRVAMVLAGK